MAVRVGGAASPSPLPSILPLAARFRNPWVPVPAHRGQIGTPASSRSLGALLLPVLPPLPVPPAAATQVGTPR